MRKKFRKEIRILGVDDSCFNREKYQNVLVIGAFFRGGSFLDGILSTKVRKDGDNSTKKLTEVVNKSKWKSQLRAILLDGIALAGFNVVDIKKLNEKTSIPVIAVMRKYPDKDKIFSALKKIRQEKKIKLIEKAGKIHKTGKIYFQFAGISLKKAEEIISLTTTYAYIPEPVRIAHIVAAGVVNGESSGRA
ncbi:DUF99 family protein [Candidatus Woesearchaeota archaeon]|nr:DUF99 family protein [Candidatus Woesearchaeota archaeon]